MSLSGAFTTMPLPDLLQWVSDSRRGGLLSLTFEFDEAFLLVEEGSIVGVDTDDAHALDLGQLCLERGLVDEPTLRRLDATARASGADLADVIAEDHLFSRPLLDQIYGEGALAVVWNLFLRREGRFHFSTTQQSLVGGDPPRRLARPIEIRGMLMEAMRRLDEWQRIVEIFPSDLCQVHALGHAEGLPILEELHRRGEPVPIGELWSRRTADRYHIYEQLHQAYRAGLLAVDADTMPQDEVPARSSVDTLVKNGEILIGERQFEEAATILRGALNLDPFRADVRDLLTRAREEQLAELYQTLPPYKVPVLRVPRERLPRLGLSERERRLATRINGRWDVGALALMFPIGELETLRALKKLLHVGAVGFAD